MKHSLANVLVAMIILVSLASAQSKSLLLQPFENHQAVTDQEAARINETFALRLQTIKTWAIVDSAKTREAIPQGQPCDQDCLVSSAQKLSADLVIMGSIESTSKPGVVDVTVTLIDPATWREVQKESITIGPEIEKGLGQVSGMAKLFDASSQTAIVPESKPDEVSNAAGWVLGGAALMVLGFVIYSIL